MVSLKNQITTILARNSPTAHKRKRALQKFADKTGLVYFGQVDQRNDDHRVIRGLTVSATHVDSDYTVGTFDDYDVTIVNRQDRTFLPDRTSSTHEWLILEIQLHTLNEIPHLFLAARHQHDGMYRSLFTSTSILSPVRLGTFEEYSPEFKNRYEIYSAPSHAIEAERIITNKVAQTIGVHFWPFSIEIFMGSVYVYADHQQVTSHLLDTMLTDGIWIAKTIDITINTI